MMIPRLNDVSGKINHLPTNVRTISEPHPHVNKMVLRPVSQSFLIRSKSENPNFLRSKSEESLLGVPKDKIINDQKPYETNESYTQVRFFSKE